MLSICSDKIMTMDFGLGENPDFIDEAQRYIYAFASNDSGIEGVYNQVFELGGHLVACHRLLCIYQGENLSL